MSLSNFLPVNRKLQEHWIFKDSCYLHCWMEMLFNARFSEEPKIDIFKGSVYTINRGEFIFSRSSYAKRLNIKESKIRTFLNLLIESKMLEKVASLGENKPTIYKICNYEVYNGSSNYCQANTEQTPSEHLVNTEQTPSEHVDIALFYSDVHRANTQSSPSEHPVNTEQTPLKKNVKKDKNVNNEKENIYTTVYSYYMDKDLIKHKALTSAMKKAIDKAMNGEHKLDTEYMCRIIDRHKIKSQENIKGFYTRTLAQLFGQKKYKSEEMIYEDYLDEVWENRYNSNTVKDSVENKLKYLEEF